MRWCAPAYPKLCSQRLKNQAMSIDSPSANTVSSRLGISAFPVRTKSAEANNMDLEFCLRDLRVIYSGWLFPGQGYISRFWYPKPLCQDVARLQALFVRRRYPACFQIQQAYHIKVTLQWAEEPHFYSPLSGYCPLIYISFNSKPAHFFWFSF